MQGTIKSVILGLLVVPFVAVTGAMEGFSEMAEELNEMPVMSMLTDNGSTLVDVIIENAVIEGNQFTIDQPQVVTFNIIFLDPLTGIPLQHVNYKFTITDEEGNIVHKIHNNHVHDGLNAYSLLFANTGSFTLTIDVEGTGAPPYDTTHTGTATSSVAVTPEFPLSVMIIMATVVGIGVAATRFKNHLKL